jgi:hypothetical protein
VGFWLRTVFFFNNQQVLLFQVPKRDSKAVRSFIRKESECFYIIKLLFTDNWVCFDAPAAQEYDEEQNLNQHY